MMWSRTQAVVAMSSGEAELYALTKGAANTLGMLSLVADFGQDLDGHVSSDASAAIGMVNRTGVGKLRHVRVQYLWLQDKVRTGELEVAKVPGISNPADLFTKHLDEASMTGHLERLGFQLRKDRASSAPSVHLLREGGKERKVRIEEYCEIEPQETMREDQHGEQEDYWTEHGDFLVRRHQRARRELFTPLRVQGSPPAKALTGTRITAGVYEDGSTFRVVDAWTARAHAHAVMSGPWKGTTTFVKKTLR